LFEFVGNPLSTPESIYELQDIIIKQRLRKQGITYFTDKEKKEVKKDDKDVKGDGEGDQNGETKEIDTKVENIDEKKGDEQEASG